MYKILLFILLSISIKSFSIPPTPYNVTGGGYYCSEGSGIQIGLSGSQSGVSYQLLRSGTIIMGTSIVGTGSQIVFPNQTVAGIYTIKATNTLNESSLMNGSSVVSVVSSTTLPGIPGTISGATDACLYIPSDTLIYKTTRSTNTTSYLWTVPSGASIIGNNSDTFIRVKYSSSFAGTLPIKVSAVNSCYNNSIGSARSLTIYKRVASTPGVIQKSFFPSVVATSDVCDVIYDTFMIRKVLYATSYLWSITTATGTIRRISTGANDTAIRLYISADFVKDTLSVRSVNACSVSLPRTLALTTQRLPPTPIAIVSGPGYYNPCVGYYITFVAASPEPTSSQHRTSMYHWTIPRNTSIVSAYYDSSFITVLFGAGYTGGTVTLKGGTSCGTTGSSKSQAVTLGDCSTPNLIMVGNYIYTNISGGTPPYTCSLNNGPFQPIDTIKNIPPGNYTLLIKDFNGCTKPINVALYDSIRITSLYYTASNTTVYINSNAPGTMVFKNSVGSIVLSKSYTEGSLRPISVSTLPVGTYTASTYNRSLIFTK
jgi:hypothetical protein